MTRFIDSGSSHYSTIQGCTQQNIAKMFTLKFPQSLHGAESQPLSGKDQEITPTLKAFRAFAKEQSF